MPLTVRLRSLGRLVGRALRLPPAELITTLHAFALLVLVELAIRSLPLRRVGRLLGVAIDLAPRSADVERLPATALAPRAQRRLRCTQRLTDRWPTASGPCLRWSLVAGHLLREYHPAVRLGVKGTGADDLVAHAWLEIGDRPLEPVSDYEAFEWPTARVPA